MKFEPADLKIHVGDTVVWKNDDLVPHTATSAGNFDSKMIEGGKSFRTVIKKKGEFNYLCILHVNMTGKITAE